MIEFGLGELIWCVGFEIFYVFWVNFDIGFCCVFFIYVGWIYVFGVEGEFCCFELESGNVCWICDFYVEYFGDEGYFGVGLIFIIVVNCLFFNVGGRWDVGIIVIDFDIGEMIWNLGIECVSYLLLIKVDFDGVIYVVFVMCFNVIGFDFEDGSEWFWFEFGVCGLIVNVVMLIVCEDVIFFLVSYGVGGWMECIFVDVIEMVWENDFLMLS